MAKTMHVNIVLFDYKHTEPSKPNTPVMKLRWMSNVPFKELAAVANRAHSYGMQRVQSGDARNYDVRLVPTN